MSNTHGMHHYTLSEQRDIVLRYLPIALRTAEAALKSSDLSRMIADRLTTGDDVFGSGMFFEPSAELHHEYIEELADAILYCCAMLHRIDQKEYPR